MKPLIGITTKNSTNSYGQPTILLQQSYVRAVMQAGGVPDLIPSSIAEDGWDALYARLDGVLLSGGGDIAHEHFTGEAHPRIDDVDPARDSVELKLVHAAAEDGKPFLGICRGCQMMNVALGGTLYTHIPDQLPGALDHSYPGGYIVVVSFNPVFVVIRGCHDEYADVMKALVGSKLLQKLKAVHLWHIDVQQDDPGGRGNLFSAVGAAQTIQRFDSIVCDDQRIQNVTLLECPLNIHTIDFVVVDHEDVDNLIHRHRVQY